MSLCPHHPDERMMYAIERAWAERNHLPESDTRQYYTCKSCMDASEADAPEVTFGWTDKPEPAPLRSLLPQRAESEESRES